VKGMAINQPIDLEEALLRFGYTACHNHVTEGNKGFQSMQDSNLRAVTVTNPLRLSK
jgi:hypothetical protein